MILNGFFRSRISITANIRIYVTSETNVCKHLKMKGIPQEKMKEIIDYFFKNKNNTAGDIANKFGLKQWQADKIVSKIQIHRKS